MIYLCGNRSIDNHLEGSGDAGGGEDRPYYERRVAGRPQGDWEAIQ